MVVNARAYITALSLGNTICCLPVVLSMSSTSVTISSEAHNTANSHSCLWTAEVGKEWFLDRGHISTKTGWCILFLIPSLTQFHLGQIYSLVSLLVKIEMRQYFLEKKYVQYGNYFEHNNVSFSKRRIFNQTSISYGFKKKLTIKTVLYPMTLKRRKSKIKLRHWVWLHTLLTMLVICQWGSTIFSGIIFITFRFLLNVLYQCFMPCIYSAQAFVFPRGEFLISSKCRTEKNANSGSLIAVQMDSCFHEKLFFFFSLYNLRVHTILVKYLCIFAVRKDKRMNNFLTFDKV